MYTNKYLLCQSTILLLAETCGNYTRHLCTSHDRTNHGNCIKPQRCDKRPAQGEYSRVSKAAGTTRLLLQPDTLD